MLFDPAAVQAFKENADLVEFLALCRWGWQCGKLDTRGAGYFGKWTRNGKPIFKPWQEFFSFHTTEFYDGTIERHPAGWGAVPDEVTRWSTAAARVLTRREVETLCAVFIASVEVPPLRHNQASYYASLRDIPAIVKKLRSIGEPSNTAQWRIFHGHLNEAGTGDGAHLRDWLRVWFPDDEAGMFRHLCAYARKKELQRKKAAGFPKLSAVGGVMRIQRAQAGQLCKRTFKKLDRAGLFDELAGVFNVHRANHEPDPGDNDYFSEEIDRIARRGHARCAFNNDLD